MNYFAILDGASVAAGGSATRQARALAGFVNHGLGGDLAGQTLAFYHDARDRQRLVALAPTRAVRLVKVTARGPERLAEILAAVACEDRPDLVLFAGGAAGAELAARLASRSGGAVLTGALDAEARAERLLARKRVYSGHLVGRFELAARPWCVSIDAAWDDHPRGAEIDHQVLSDTDAPGTLGETGAAGSAPLEDVELVAVPSAGDVAESRFLVVAGQGAGSRERVAKIAEAARRMGACFAVTRPVAMNAWAPMDRLVGVSGSRAAPELCIVVGASGAPAFFWGVEQAAFIVAVNPDAQAPIVRGSDVALLDDGVAVMEALAEVVAERGEHT